MCIRDSRNIVIFLFPVVIQCIESQAKERRLWLLLAYMIRSSIIPNEEYCNVGSLELQDICEVLCVIWAIIWNPELHIYSAYRGNSSTKNPWKPATNWNFRFQIWKFLFRDQKIICCWNTINLKTNIPENLVETCPIIPFLCSSHILQPEKHKNGIQ